MAKWQQTAWCGRMFSILLWLVVGVIPHTMAQPLTLTENRAAVIDLHPWLQQFQGEEGQSWQNLPPKGDPRWQGINHVKPNGIGANNLWLRIDITVHGSPGRQILSINNPLLDRIDLIHLVDGKLFSKWQFGDNLPFNARLMNSQNFLYPIQFNSGKHHSLLLKISTDGGTHLPITLQSPDYQRQESEKRNLILGLQLGIMMAIGLFSLFVALASGSFSYSYYAAYVLSTTLLFATVQGVAFHYLWPNWPQIQTWLIPFLLPVCICFALMFAEKVLQLKKHSIAMLRLCRVSAALSLLLALLSLLLGYKLALYGSSIMLLWVSMLLLAFALILAMRGHKLAKLYLFGWSPLLACAVFFSLTFLGVVHPDFDPIMPAMHSVTLEIVFMAAVLAIRYNDERQAKLRIQQEALTLARQHKEDQEEALRQEASTNERLEKMVEERTLELEIVLRELNELNARLTEQTTIDGLTGVKNRTAFDKRLQAEGRISRRQNTPLALLMLDIDHFKQINDIHGHLAGDRALKDIAKLITAELKRPTDLISRFGGEEFAMILPSTNAEGAMMVAENIRQAVESLTIEWEGKMIPLTVSIGVSSNLIAGEDQALTLLDQADKALYQAKHQGRNRVCLYNDTPDTLQ